MPHITFIKNQELSTPISSNGVDFTFIAKSYNNTCKNRDDEYKIAVRNKDKEFLLSLRNKKPNMMIKYDKISRISPIQIVKDALNEYISLSKAKIVFTNTNDVSNKVQVSNEYLKDISFFVNDFKSTKELQIEVGFGSGRHLIHQALKNPHIQFIGLEIHTPSIEQALKQIEIQEIKNILIINYDARLFLEFIKSNSVGKVFVHFPVPWDKKPHRRVYSNDFISEALRVLKKQGSLELRTDSRKYFDYCSSLLTNLNSGKIIIDINKDLEVSSKYEDRWKKQGKNIYDVVLICNQEDEEKIHYDDFNFKDDINLINVLENLSTKPLVIEDYFIHIEDVYIIQNQEHSALIQLTFGSFNKPLSKYILIKNKKASYYQGNPIPTSANIKAHKKIKEILQND